MDPEFSRRGLLGSAGVLAAGGITSAIPTRGAVQTSGQSTVLYEDDFSDNTLSEYGLSFHPSGTAESTSAGGSASWSPEDEWLLVESPEGSVAVLEPPVKAPETGHVHVRLDVVRNNAPTSTFAVRLVESEDRWVEFAAMGDGDRFAIVDYDDGGVASIGQLGPEAPVSGRHAADLFWSPDKRAVYLDSEFHVASSRSEGSFEFSPRRLELRNVHDDTRLRYWRLDDRHPPAGTSDVETPALPTGSPVGTAPPTGTSPPTDPYTPTPPGGDQNGEPPSTEEWLRGWGPLVATVVGVPVVGPAVLGGLLLAVRLFAPGDDAE